MKRRRTVKRGVLVLLLLMAGGGIASVLVNTQFREALLGLWQQGLEWADLAAPSVAAEQVYWCPMHPDIKRDEPSTCPICNMALVLLEKGAEADTYDGLTLTARHVQQAGVTVEPVLERALRRELDTTGRIVPDERRLAKITSWVYGKARIHALHVNFTGESVEKGQLLAKLFAPDLIIAQQELLIPLHNASVPGSAELIKTARTKLLYQGLTEAQVDDIIEAGTALEYVPVYAPINGTVIERHVSEGEYVREGEPLFHLADLSHLWLYLDIYEDELPLVSLEQPVEISVRGRPGETFEGNVVFIDPIVQPETRTVRVRLNIDNPSGTLKPGMYARARITKELPSMLAVASDAVLWSGRRTIVIVKEGSGRFRPVEVSLGRRWLYSQRSESANAETLEFSSGARQYHEVLEGLTEGDEVVTSGAFLLNAESQFQSVLTKLLPRQEAPVAEMPASMANLLAAYYELSEHLANDKLDPLADSANHLVRAAEALATEAAEEDDSTLAAAAEHVARAATDFAKITPAEPDAARTAFASISRAIVDLLAEHGGPRWLGDKLFLFECPMADEFGFKQWLQPNEDMRNPYMGQRMLKCGMQKEMFER